MSKITYQTKLTPTSTQFCESMGLLFGKIERDLYKDLERGEKINNLKKNYQVKYGINARQFNSINIILRGKRTSRKECHKRQIKQIKLKIKGLEKNLKSWKNKLKKTNLSCGYQEKSIRKKIKFTIHQKQRKLGSLKDNFNKLKKKKPTLIFGGKKLWKAQFNLKENGYSSHEEWLKDWRNSRSSQFTLVGSKDEKLGNQNCQLLEDGTLKIRVPRSLESNYGKYYCIVNVFFPYGQKDVEYALNNEQALTFRFVKKEDSWYLFCTFELLEVPILSKRKKGMLGIDLNPNVIGWSYCDSEGNLKEKGQIKFNVRDKTTNQTKAIIGDIVKELIDLSSHYLCPIVVEDLDFEKKKATMKDNGVKYSRMLSNFAYSCFFNMLNSRAFKYGIEVIKVNPAFSSLIGLTKYMRLYGLSSDTAAALVLARRALRKSEGIPTNYARLVQVDASRHVWSSWNGLSKRLKGRKRHSFFNSVSNREVKVTPLDELHCNRFNGKSKDTFTAR